MNSTAQFLDGAINGDRMNLLCISQEGCVKVRFQAWGDAKGPFTFIYEVNNKIDTISTTEIYDCYSDKPIIDTVYQRNEVLKYYKQNEIFSLYGNNGFIIFNLISISNKDTTVVLNKKFDTQMYNQNSIQIPLVNACFGDEVTLDPSPYSQVPIGNINWFYSNSSNTTVLKVKVNQSEDLSFSGVDVMGCAINGFAHITMYDKIEKPLASIDSAACNNGSIELKNIDSTYKYFWGPGQNFKKLEKIIAGNYKLNISDEYGCKSSFIYNVPKKANTDACGTITGNVYYDLNKNCSKDLEDKSVSFKTIVANPGEYIAVTNLKGEYTFALPYGSYTIEEVNWDNLTTSCIKEQNIILDSTDMHKSDINFYDTTLINYDVKSDLVINNIRPGFTFNVYPSFSDYFGERDFSTEKTWFTFPDSISIVNCNFPYTISKDTLFFNLDSTYTKDKPIILEVKAARRIILGSLLDFCAGIDGNKNESNTQNNITCLSVRVRGSYDPNDKKLFVNGIEKNGNILAKDTILDYQIRFQNTGNADAINIFVIDTISENLDLKTFELISSSHKCDVIYLGKRVYKFDFPNIHLIDSVTNEPLSHGYIKYRIKQNRTNVIGTEIKNTAYIYFDFNDPVITNTTSNTVSIESKSLGISTKSLSQLKLYPNPVNSQLTIENNESILGVNIINLDGKLMKQLSNLTSSSTYILNVEDLTEGLYIIEIVGTSSVQRSRIIKQ